MSSTPKLTIRPGTAADVDSILELVKLSLGEGSIPRQREYWDWKHRLNPFGESPVLLAESAGRLVGLRVFMRWEWSVAGNRARAVRAVDTATHPDWRGRGVFSQLTMALVKAMRDEGVNFVFNTPNDQSRPGYLKMGWRRVGRTDLMIRPIRPLGMVGGLVRRREPGHSAAVPHVDPPTCARAGEVLSNPEVLRFLTEQPLVSGDRRLRTPRDPAYLVWRYGAVPGIDYHALASIDENNGALLIFRLKPRPSAIEVRICELIHGASDESPALARELLARLQREVVGDYISIMASPFDERFGMLLRSGFVPAPRLGPILTVLPLHDVARGTDPLLRRDWLLSTGDLELF